MRNRLRLIFAAWREISVAIGNFQARLILTVMYFTVVLVFSALTRLFLDSLGMRRQPRDSAWVPRQPVNTELGSARRQY